MANDRQFDNTNRGTLGKNKNKDPRNPDHDKKPDYSGKINIEGRDYWLSGWLKESKENGEKFFSLSVQPKDEQPRRDDRGSGNGRRDDRDQRDNRRRNIDDEIPF